MGVPARRIVYAIVLGIAVPLAGCFSMRPSASERRSPAPQAPAEVWPARNEVVARDLLAQTPRVIHAMTPPDGAALPGGAEVEFEVSDMRIASGGALRFYRKLGAAEEDSHPIASKINAMLGDFRPNGSYVSSTVVQGARFRDWVDQQRALIADSPVSDPRLPAGTRRSGLAAEIGLEAGVPFQVPEPGSPEIGTRGLIVHFTALTSNEYEKRFLDQLRARGWTVIDFATWVGLDAPRQPEAMARLPQLEREQKACMDEWKELGLRAAKAPSGEQRVLQRRIHELAARSAELAGMIATIKRGWYVACTPDEAAAAGRAIAAASDDGFAENAYAAEAVLDFLREHRPDLPTEPVAVVGFSAGALVAPAVAARLGERVRGLVLIGGGADAVTIARESSLKRVSLALRCGDQPVGDDLFMVARDAYRRHVWLDPYALGPSLSQTPVLLVHAVADRIVPADTGVLMWERLGRPDRLDFSLDHYELFYFVPGQAPRVARWLDEHVPPSPKRPG